jgi:dephospho-CoA kinase
LLFIGLTGGIGSGKSEALAACRRAGAAVLSSDQVVHNLLETDEVKELLTARWGEDVLSDGQIDRGAVARIVFDNPEQLQWLERNLFPLVGAEIAAWRSELEASVPSPRVAVVEVPLLFEAGADRGFDTTIAVVAEEGLRAERAAARGHHGVDERAARQLSQEEKASRAEHVLRNNGTLEDLDREVVTLLRRLTGEGSGS